MIILCDVDGVLASLTAEILRRYNHDYNDNLSLEKALTAWDFYEFVKPECGRKVLDYMMAPDLYDGVQVIEGAKDGVQRLRDSGHTVFFVSKCAWCMTDQKAWWLRAHLFTSGGYGVGLPRDLIVTRDKTLIRGDLLIEDSGQTVKQWTERTGKPAILLDYPHNRDVSGAFIFRAHDWPDIVDTVDFLVREEERISAINPAPTTDSRPTGTNPVGKRDSARGGALRR